MEINNSLVAAVDAATRVAGLADVGLNITYGDRRDRLPKAIRDSLVVRGALSFLIGHGYLAPTEQLAGSDEWMALDLTPDMAAAYQAVVQAAVDAQARVEALLPGRPAGRSGWAPAADTVQRYIDDTVQQYGDGPGSAR